MGGVGGWLGWRGGGVGEGSEGSGELNRRARGRVGGRLGWKKDVSRRAGVWAGGASGVEQQLGPLRACEETWSEGVPW